MKKTISVSNNIDKLIRHIAKNESETMSGVIQSAVINYALDMGYTLPKRKKSDKGEINR